MAVDFQLVFPRNAVRLTSVTRTTLSGAPALNVVGDDFRSVDEVLVNGRASPDYRVQTATRLVAALPEGVALRDVESVSVTSRELTMTPRSILAFRVGLVPTKTTGILRLVQLFVKVLFTTPGTDIFNKSLGGGALRAIGSRSGGRQEVNAVVNDFVVAVGNTKRQIVAIQSRQPRLPPDERLLEAKVVSARFSPEQEALLASVELTSQAGQMVRVNSVV